MDDKIKRFFTSIRNDKVRSFFAFLFYLSFISMCIDLPLILNAICFVVQIITLLLAIIIYIIDLTISTPEDEKQISVRKNIWQEAKKIANEILMFIPVLLISVYITSFIMVGKSANQISIDESFKEAPIFNSILMIVIGPIIEEFIFRFLPYKFIKNKTLYILVSSVIFAAMHVVDDPNAFYYIWFYMIRALYYAYRYHKTQDILVPISMHSLNNLLATLPMILSYF